MNPFASLLKSRKFWLMILDLVVSFTVYFVTKYAAPELSKDILYVIAGVQPAFVTIIGAIAYEDAANANASAIASYDEKPEG